MKEYHDHLKTVGLEYHHYINWNLLYLVGGFSPPLRQMMEFVSWDDDYSQYMESNKSHVPVTANQYCYHTIDVIMINISI